MLKISRYSLKGQFLQSYSSVAEAAKAMETVRTNITRALDPETGATACGYIWRYGMEPEIDVQALLKKRPYAGGSPLSKQQQKIGQYDMEGNLVATHIDTKAAGRAVGVHYQGIRKVINGRAWTYGGFIWRRSTKKKIAVASRIIDIKFGISQYDLNGRWMRSFKSGLEASRITGIGNDNISRAINDENTITAGGYLWRRGQALRINITELRKNPHFPGSKLSTHLKKTRQKNLEQMTLEQKENEKVKRVL
ncbi:NUMOD1 domain-containing DNA-binding protein [Pedobacter sp. GR22-6]|uniref:NUMOD1 domain-containing DNA-binding protein n=1 Tax=Pedobacter sp. GR22-6 TaxID=3127957 RepID=UPI00307E36E1